MYIRGLGGAAEDAAAQISAALVQAGQAYGPEAVQAAITASTVPSDPVLAAAQQAYQAAAQSGSAIVFQPPAATPAPTPPAPVPPAETGGMGWLWLVAAGVGAYLLFGKKKGHATRRATYYRAKARSYYRRRKAARRRR